jgi:hypothetical protein
VRKALAEHRPKEAVDRLFGRKFDSLRRLVERMREKEAGDPVREYVTLLCALQTLKALEKDEPDFYAQQRPRFQLADEVRHALGPVKERFTFATPEERQEFFDWMEKWFLRRATPPEKKPAA